MRPRHDVAIVGAGQLFVQGRVRRGGALGLFDDVVGRGFALLSPSGDPGAHLDAAPAAFFAALGGVTAQVGGGGVADVDGVYAAWFAEHGVDLVLQRPDFYVFGTAARVADAGTLVARLRAALTG